jgi:hypothetical protein
MCYQQFVFSCLLRGRFARFQDGVATGKGSPYTPIWVYMSVITVQREICARFGNAGICIIQHLNTSVLNLKQNSGTKWLKICHL